MATTKKAEKIVARAMTIEEYEEYIELLPKWNEEYKENSAKQMLEMAKWVAANIYKVELSELKCTPGTIIGLLKTTIELSEVDENEDIKN